ncbi:MAG: polysaccharide deacetylase family protein [Vulcanimicrobiaceae bacterium]
MRSGATNRTLLGILLAAVGLGVLGVLLAHRLAELPSPAIVPQAEPPNELFAPSLRSRIERLVQEHVRPRPSGPADRLVALTFDDGPYPVETPLLLDVLRDERVPATFFLIGRDASEFPGLAQAIERDGNEIADHTETHPADFDRLSVAASTREIVEGAATLGRYVHDPAIRRFMRPPHGRYSESSVIAAQRAGYAIVLWNDDPGDWKALPAAALAEHVIAHATAPDIILLHSGKPATIAMLPQIIERFRGAGFRFVTVGTLVRRLPLVQIDHPAKVAI